MLTMGRKEGDRAGSKGGRVCAHVRVLKCEVQPLPFLLGFTEGRPMLHDMCLLGIERPLPPAGTEFFVCYPSRSRGRCPGLEWQYRGSRQSRA